jgi:2',3'-cyclic-nucleotide 2'-phosphodiesterase (5'-nucleotidase family)
MKLVKLLSFLLILFVLVGCETTKKISNGDDGQIEIVILQTNDVYEIAPLEGGTVGGMARLAQLKQDLLAQNPNTFSVMAGDFLNPSVIGSLKYEGERIKGKHMVETMNAAGIDLVTFGNHEFDLDEEDLQKRLNESEFNWTCSNVFQKQGAFLKPFQQRGIDIPKYWIEEFTDADGTKVKIGFIGVCLDLNKRDYMHYEDPFESFKKIQAEITDKVDIVVGLTHQTIEEDKALAAQIQGIPLFMGGHEHNNMIHKVGEVTITKADANAKTAYIHTLKYNKTKKKLSLNSALKAINSSIPFDTKTNAVVEKWTAVANSVLKEAGIDPNEIIVKLTEPIDATEHFIRHQPSVICSIMVQAIGASYPTADGAFANTGSIRLDDILSGKITQYDIVRLLPFGGSCLLVEMKGSLLLELLQTGYVDNVGNGGYFALDRLTYDAATKSGTVNGQQIDSNAAYKIAVPSFLLKGVESNLAYFTPKHPGIIHITEASTDSQKDVRLAVIEWMKKNAIPKY